MEAQAQDRIHRLGQHKPIDVTRFVIGGTIEERILKLQARSRPSVYPVCRVRVRAYPAVLPAFSAQASRYTRNVVIFTVVTCGACKFMQSPVGSISVVAVSLDCLSASVSLKGFTLSLAQHV